MNNAIASLISHGEGFLIGASVLGESLREHATEQRRILLVEDGAYNSSDIAWMVCCGWEVRIVAPIRSQPAAFAKERWPFTFTKLQLWSMVDLDCVFYLDADCVVHSPDVSGVFALPFDDVLACPVGTKHKARIFNAGVMVIRPNAETFAKLHETITTRPASETKAADSDQGFLNVFFHRFDKLPDKFNWRYWDGGIPSGVVVSHLRPHPWTDEPKKPGQKIALAEWERYRAIAAKKR